MKVQNKECFGAQKSVTYDNTLECNLMARKDEVY